MNKISTYPCYIINDDWFEANFFLLKTDSMKELKNSSFFEPAILDYYFTKNTHLLLLHPHENQSQIMWQNDWDSILMFYMVSSKFLAVRNIMLYSVILNQLKMLSNSVGKEKLHSYFFSYIIRQHISKTA